MITPILLRVRFPVVRSDNPSAVDWNPLAVVFKRVPRGKTNIKIV